MRNISRRTLIQGAAAVAATATVASAAIAEEAAGYEVAEVMDCDIVVVGSGTSGMVATVQAAELGAKTICLEKNAFLGGNGLGTEDVFALGTSDQEAAGVEVPTFRGPQRASVNPSAAKFKAASVYRPKNQEPFSNCGRV